MSDAQTAWTIFLAGVAAGLLVALAGVALLANRALALKKRIDAYAELPVGARIGAANAVIASHAPGVASATLVAERARLAVAALSAAREEIAQSFAAVKAMWLR